MVIGEAENKVSIPGLYGSCCESDWVLTVQSRVSSGCTKSWRLNSGLCEVYAPAHSEFGLCHKSEWQSEMHQSGPGARCRHTCTYTHAVTTERTYRISISETIEDRTISYGRIADVRTRCSTTHGNGTVTIVLFLTVAGKFRRNYLLEDKWPANTNGINGTLKIISFVVSMFTVKNKTIAKSFTREKQNIWTEKTTLHVWVPEIDTRFVYIRTCPSLKISLVLCHCEKDGDKWRFPVESYIFISPPRGGKCRNSRKWLS